MSFLSYQVREVGQVGQEGQEGQLPPQDAGDSHQMVTVETMHSVAESIKRNQQDEVAISVLPGSAKTEWLHVAPRGSRDIVSHSQTLTKGSALSDFNDFNDFNVFLKKTRRNRHPTSAGFCGGKLQGRWRRMEDKSLLGSALFQHFRHKISGAQQKRSARDF